MIGIPLSQPDITDHEIAAVTAVLRSGRLSIGPKQEAFERMVAQRAGREHGIAVSSGTAGLHLLMLSLGIKPGDEVLTTPFSFVASANCALMVGAKPVFVDIDPRTLNMDPAKLEAAITEKTKAIVAVEVFGNPAQMDRIASIARQHEVAALVVAHDLRSHARAGSLRRSVHMGIQRHDGRFSFDRGWHRGQHDALVGLHRVGQTQSLQLVAQQASQLELAG